jgi:serine/threonine-protein kinase HipA
MSGQSLLVQLQRPSGQWIDVGLLRSRSNTNWFEIYDSYWEMRRRPVLGQVFEDRSRSWRPSSHVALPHWFSHLLPEGQLRHAVAEAAGISEATEFQLLATVGADDLPGAIRVLPWHENSGAEIPATVIEELSDKENDPILKFSLAGLQMKFSIQKNERGLTVPVAGTAGNMILKLPDSRPGFDGIPQAEFAAMTLAKNAGIQAPDIELVQPREVEGLGRWASGGLAFAIVRFDRSTQGRRIHTEEFAQILNIPAAREHVKYSYANFEAVANIASRLVSVDSVREIINRIVLNVLIGNGDAHLKNWTMVYPDGMNPALSPIYDVLPTVLYVSNDDLGLNLNGSKRFEDVTHKSFARMGEVTDFGASEATTEAKLAVKKVLDAWHVLDDLLPHEQLVRLNQRLASLPLRTI